MIDRLQDPRARERELDASRSELVEREQQARSRLMDAIEKLVRLRRNALDPRLQLRRHLAGVVAAGGVLVAAAAVIMIVLMHRHEIAGRRRQRARWRLAKSV
jgi:hypothetical protein